MLFGDEDVLTTVSKKTTIVVLNVPFITAHNYCCFHHSTISSWRCYVSSHLFVLHLT